MSTVHVVVPAGIDDPSRPSGGNVYDRRTCNGLAGRGWVVIEHQVDVADLARTFGDLEAGMIVLIDGLSASAAPDILISEAKRLRLVVLVHMIFGEPGEGAVLAAASRVVTTSQWTRKQLLSGYGLAPERVHVAEPGVDAAPIAAVSDDGMELLCVAAVTAHKGHDTLVSALTELADLLWRFRFVGSLDREPRFVEALLRRVEAAGLGDRIVFTGPLVDDDLDHAYAAADVVVLPSQAETYGMVVTEALAHGLPVIATEVGGLPEALGRTTDGQRPGILVPPNDPAALAAALRTWLSDADLRHRLRDAALERRSTLSGWDVTTDHIARALTSPEPVEGPISRSLSLSKRRLILRKPAMS